MKEPIKKGIKSAIKVAWDLLKIIIPIIFLLTFLKETAIFEYIANLLNPVMGIFGLPGEAAIALVIGFFLSIHAAAGIALSINLSIIQMTILGLMVTISHALIQEIAVLKKIKVNYIRMFFLRIITSFIIGIGANWVVQWII